MILHTALTALAADIVTAYKAGIDLDAIDGTELTASVRSGIMPATYMVELTLGGVPVFEASRKHSRLLQNPLAYDRTVAADLVSHDHALLVAAIDAAGAEMVRDLPPWERTPSALASSATGIPADTDDIRAHSD